MKSFSRNDQQFSLCGLNCSLCTMKLDGYCPGCGGGAGNQVCAIARCSLKHGNIEYCHLCEEYPCERYEGIDEFDSFITHRNQLKDMEKMKRIGVEQYHFELSDKKEILDYLLMNCNDGRRKSFFALAVNLLELKDLKGLMDTVARDLNFENLALNEKAIFMVSQLKLIAERNGIILKLNKKKRNEN